MILTRSKAMEVMETTLIQLWHITGLRVDTTMANNSEIIDFINKVRTLIDKASANEFKNILEYLDGEGFARWFSKMGELARSMSLATAHYYQNAVLVLPESIAEFIEKAKDREIENILKEISAEELSWSLTYGSKKTILGNLVKRRVSENGEKQILKIIQALTEEEKGRFIVDLGENRAELLRWLMAKINGQNKVKLYCLLGDIIIPGSGEKPVENIQLLPMDWISFESNGKIGVLREAVKGTIPGLQRIYSLDPYTMVSYETRGSRYTIPAFFLTDEFVLESYYARTEFRNMFAEEQLRFLREAVDGVKDTGAKGRKADELRTYREQMKLEELFLLAPTFMNETLRDFLNLNDDGTENYGFENIKFNDDWNEMVSAGSVYHQTMTDKTKITIMFSSNGITEPSPVTVRNKLNAKFIHKRDGREVVFDCKKKMVKEYPDKGTYNYHPVFMITGAADSVTTGPHTVFDIKPYNERMEKEDMKIEQAGNLYFWYKGNSVFWELEDGQMVMETNLR